MVKRKNAYDDEEEGQFDFTNNQSVSEIRTRKKIISALPLPTTTTSSPGKRLRKNTRLKLYYRSMKELNTKFATWAKEEEHRICAKVENGELTSTSVPVPLFYEADVMLYRSKVKEINRRYKPVTGDVLTFGSGDFGQLGHAYKEDANNDAMVPRCVVSLRNTGIVSVSCGGLHTIFACESGKVLSCGSNDEGNLGILELHTGYTPQEVKGFIPSADEVAKCLEQVHAWKDVTGKDVTDPRVPLDPQWTEESIIAVTAGDSHNLCLSSTGRVYFFGAYKDKDGKPWRDLPPTDDPRKYTYMESKEVPDDEQIAKNKEEARKSGKVINEDEEKKKPVPTKTIIVPKKADIPPAGIQGWPIHVWQMPGEVISIDCGVSFNAAIVEEISDGGSSTQSCVTWGLGECGELARPVFMPVRDPHHEFKEGEDRLADYAVDKIRDEYLVPKPVIWKNPTNKRTVEAIGCGGWHLLVVSRDLTNGVSSVHSSGLNNYGQLGLGDSGENVNRLELTEIESFRGKNTIQVSAGMHHSLALEANGNLYSFGRADYGQLGNTDEQPKAGDMAELPVPVYLDKDKANPIISHISSGNHTNFVLTGGGDVYSWGYGDTGSLGHGIEEDENGYTLQCSDEFRPRKLDVLKKINKDRAKKGRSPFTANVHSFSSGGQHSSIVCSLLEN